MRNNCLRLKLWQLNIIKLVFLLFVTAGVIGPMLGCGKETLEKMESFHPNGKIWERWYEDSAGNKQGKVQTYYPNGKLQTEADFMDGYLNGEFVMWSKDGDELSRGTYKNGDPWAGTFLSVDDMQQQVVFDKYEEGKLVK